MFGAVQRNERGSITSMENAKREILGPIIYKRIKVGSHIMSDEWWAYTKLGKRLYCSKTQEERICAGNIYTNTIEGARSHLKRLVMGTYHRPSKEHLSKYCAEFEFTYNTRNNTQTSKFNQSVDKNLIRVGYIDIVDT